MTNKANTDEFIKDYLNLMPYSDDEKNKKPEANFIQVGFGLCCMKLFKNWQKNFSFSYLKPGNKKSTYYNYQTFRSVYEGFSEKSSRESSYTHEVFKNFLEKSYQIYFSSVGSSKIVVDGEEVDCELRAKGTPEADIEYYKHLFRKIMDTCIYPQRYLLKIFEKRGNTDENIIPIPQMASWLRDIWIEDISEESGKSKDDLKNFINDVFEDDKILQIFIYSMAKSIYDFGFLIGDDTTKFASVPLLHYERRSFDSQKNDLPLWGQFNKIAFYFTDKFGTQDIEFAKKQRRSKKKEEKTSKKRISDISEIMDEIYEKAISREMVGIQDLEGYYSNMAVLISEVELPQFEINWELEAVEKLKDRFINNFVKDETPTSQIVFLAGPYGTSKTSIAQFIFSKILADDGKNDWYLLRHNNKTGIYNFGWISKEDAVKEFRHNDLSRILSDEVIKKIDTDVKDNANLVVNLSELNASSASEIEEQLQILNKLIREIKEKFKPRKFIMFVAIQAFQLIGKIEQFLRLNPDLSMGRARLDKIWLIRGDIAQYDIYANIGDRRRRYLWKLIEKICNIEFAEDSPYMDRVLSRLLMPLDRKRKIMSLKIYEMDSILKEKLPILAKDYSIKLERLFRVYKKLALRGDFKNRTEWELAESSLFELGLGSYSSLTICLNNGLMRQIIEMIINEIFLDYIEFKIIKGLGEKDYNYAENNVRTKIFDEIINFNPVFNRLMNSHELLKKEKELAQVILERNIEDPDEEIEEELVSGYQEIDKSENDIFSQCLNISDWNKLITLTNRYRSANDRDTFDLGMSRELPSKFTKGDSILYFIDITKRIGSRNKGKPKKERWIFSIKIDLNKVEKNYLWEKNKRPIKEFENFERYINNTHLLWLINELTYKLTLPSGSKIYEYYRFDDHKQSLVTVDLTTARNTTDYYSEIEITFFFIDEINITDVERSIKTFFDEHGRTISTGKVQKRKFVPLNWLCNAYKNIKENDKKAIIQNRTNNLWDGENKRWKEIY